MLLIQVPVVLIGHWPRSNNLINHLYLENNDANWLEKYELCETIKNISGNTKNIRIQLWFLELHDSPLELKGELQYLDENCHFRGEKMTILV